MSLIEVNGHVLRTPDGKILQNKITFNVSIGDRLGITGPSGCGKSTLLREIAARIARASANTGTFKTDTLKLSVNSADFLPQGDFLFPWFTARQNYNAWLGLKLSRDIEQQDFERAQVLGIEALLDRRFSNLSGGERQRVALWTSLSRDNDLLIIDEPFTALDIERRSTCLEVLSEALKNRIKALIFVSHDFDVLTYLSNKILLFRVDSKVNPNTFEFPGEPPLSRAEYLYRRASNQYLPLLNSLTGAPSDRRSELEDARGGD